MQSHKEKWNNLLKEEGYQEKYVFTDVKNGITQSIGYRESGKRDYENLISKDSLLRIFLGNFSDKTVLEIGCGDGRMTEFLAKNFKQVHAIDVSKEIIKKGRKRLKKYKNIKWFENDGKTLPAYQVNFIFSYITFQHCKKNMIENNFKIMPVILLNGGIAKIQVRGISIKQDKWYSGDWYTSKELEELVVSCGFECLLVRHDPNERRYLWTWFI